MAQKEINVKIKLQSKTDVQKQLDDIIKNLNIKNIKLNVDLTDVKKDFITFQNTLNSISKNIQNIFKQSNFSNATKGIKDTTKSATQLVNVMGKSLNIGNGSKAFSELQKRANEIRNTVDSMAKINFNTTKNGNIKDATITYVDNMGKVVTETMKWKQVLDSSNGVAKRIFTTTNVKVSENIQSIDNLNQKINLLKQNLGNKLSILSNNNLIDQTVISNLQNRLNSLNTKTPKEEIEKLKLAINNLSSGESSIVRVQNKILQMENNLSNLKKTYSNTFSNNNNISSIQAYEKELNNLKNILNSLKNGQNINKNSISNSLNQASNASRNLSNTLKQNNNLLNQGNINAKSLGNSLKQGLLNAGLYLTTYQAVRKIINLFKNAIDYVKEVDKYMTNIQMITNSSQSQVQNVVNSYKNLTEELHATNTEMLAGIEEYSRAGYDENLTKEMLANSIRGAKLSNQSVEDTSEQLIAIRNAYNMVGEEVEKVTDALVTMDAKASTTFAEVAKAMQDTAFSAKEMGTSYQDLISYITVASEKTRNEPSTIGNSLKSIYSRYANIKLGNLDEDGKSINDTEKALSRIGIKIRDAKDQFRDFDDVLKEFMTKIKNNELSQVDILAGVQALGGTRQKETLLAIVNNMDRLNELQQAIGESMGSTKQKFDEIYGESIEAKISDLQRTLQDFYSNLVNSDGLKQGIELLTKFIDTFGDLPHIIGLATSALLIFKGKALTNLMSTLYGCIKGESALTVATTGLELAFKKLKLTILSNPLGAIAIAVTAVATVFSYFSDKIKQTKRELEEFNKSFNEDYGSKINNVSNAEKLLDDYKSLLNELKNLQSGTDEYKAKEEGLKNTQEQLVSIYPEINDLLNENYDNKSKLIDKTQELIDKDKELTDSQAREVLSKNDINSYNNLENLVNKYKNTQSYLESLTKADNDNLKKSFIYWNDAEGNQQGKYFANSKDIKNAISDATKESEKYSEAIMAIANAYKVLDKQGTQYEGLANKSAELMQQLGISTKEATNSQIDYAETISNSSEETEDLTEKIEKLVEQFDKLSSLIELMQKIREEIDEYGTISDNTASSILSSEDNELIASMSNVSSLYETAIKKEQEYNQQKQQNLEESIKLAQAEVNATNSKSKQYEIDTVNFLNSLNEKIKNVTLFVNEEGEVYKKITDTKGNWYVQDAKNYADALSDKIKSITFYYNEEGELMKRYIDSKGNWMDIPANEVTSTITTTPVEWNPIKPSTNLGDNSSSSSSKYDVDDLESLYDRYLKINTAIDMLNNNLEILKEKQDNLVGNDYLNSLKQEINSYKEQQNLIKQKIAEQADERWELRVKLDSAGFKFDDNDINSQILNYESQLKALTDSANAMADSDEKSAEAKKKAQERVKDLNEAIEDYNTLISQTIPNTQKEWESLNNSIKEVYKTMSDLVADGENKMYDIFEYYADKKTKKIESQLDLLEEVYNKQKEQEDLAGKQSELAKIKEQMNLYELDSSANGKAKFKELQDQYNELLEEMNDTISETQFNNVKQQMEKEKQTIEDSLKPENINTLINDALTNGFIEVGNETINLNNAINDMVSNTTIGFQNIIKNANEYNDVLKDVMATVKDIGISNINSNLGYDTSAMTTAINNSTTNKATYYSPNYTINVDANGVDSQTVSKMIINEIKEYDKTFRI